VVKFAVKTGMKVDNVDVYPNHTELLNPYVAFSVWSEVSKSLERPLPLIWVQLCSNDAYLDHGGFLVRIMWPRTKGLETGAPQLDMRGNDLRFVGRPMGSENMSGDS
jgi:hypothetical protein